VRHPEKGKGKGKEKRGGEGREGRGRKGQGEEEEGRRKGREEEWEGGGRVLETFPRPWQEVGYVVITSVNCGNVRATWNEDLHIQ